jgi:hypothetical protein
MDFRITGTAMQYVGERKVVKFFASSVNSSSFYSPSLLVLYVPFISSLLSP